MSDPADEGGEAPCYAHLLDVQRHAVVVALDDVPAGGTGAVWSLPHDGELDANLVRLEAGGAIGAHVNREVDVLVVVRRGDGEVRIDGVAWGLSPDSLVMIPVGASRSIVAGEAGIEYLSVHRRRAGLAVSPNPATIARSDDPRGRTDRRP